MKILVINAGSSSLKYQLFDMKDERLLAKGAIERIGLDYAIVSHRAEGQEEVREAAEIADHSAAVRKALQLLGEHHDDIMDPFEDIDAIGHRVVHGGEKFSESAIVTNEVIKELKDLYDLAPLHNPAHVMGIQAVEANLPGKPQVVVFDTAFHQTMPSKAYLYPIPLVFYRKHKIRKYGFHGTSYEYVSERAAQWLNRPLDQLKMVICHIGNGVSCAAIMNGKSVDTSMGMTPLEGLMMGTRSGDIDPAIVPYAMVKEELTISEANAMLNKHSGLLAISGSSDMREIQQEMDEGDPRSTLAFEMFEYRLRKYIGAYAAAMNGLDALVFTAGIGENSVKLRKKLCDQLSFLGIQIDDSLNESVENKDRQITAADSKVHVLVIPTNEELVIARDTYSLVKNAFD